ncbi:hypothetical protein APA_2548 [Pseudanabaena sp. lw0831]|nr:hypothetical protein APA_2548 [Pseudanabaena sp. lw0831]
MMRSPSTQSQQTAIAITVLCTIIILLDLPQELQTNDSDN